jgi:hypothetical protein
MQGLSLYLHHELHSLRDLTIDNVIVARITILS